MSRFIEVNKVSKVNENDVKNPLSNGEAKAPVSTGEKWKTQVEGICVDEIKSYRIWKKTMPQEAYIGGDILMLYMKSEDKSRKPPTIMIEESFESFSERLKATKLEAVGV